MNKLETAKAVASLIVSVGAGAVVGNAIKVGTPADARLIQKIAIGVGGFVLSSMVGDQAAVYAERQIDDATKSITDAITQAKTDAEA